MSFPHLPAWTMNLRLEAEQLSYYIRQVNMRKKATCEDGGEKKSRVPKNLKTL